MVRDILTINAGALTDFRLREKVQVNPPHWKRTPGEKWDAGYDKTGYFLDWIEKRFELVLQPELAHMFAASLQCPQLAQPTSIVFPLPQ